MAEHNNLGKKGEQLVVDYLIARGYAINQRNWRMGHLEIDIIATNERYVAFVEVKTRKNNFTDPIDAIDKKKVRHMVASANAYMQRVDIPLEPRFDVAGVIINTDDPLEEPSIEYIEDAFLPPLRTY